jgi:Regulator of Chromosome Condensation (RCC1) repeat protein
MQARRITSFVSKAAWTGLFLLLFSLVPVNAGNYVVAWGDDTYGQTNVPPSATNVMAIAAGYSYSLALKSDGTVIAWGQAGYTNVPAGLSNVVAIAAGIGQSLALKSDGTLVAWGIPRSSSYTNIPPGLSNVVAIACGDEHNLALKADGTMVAWGANYSGQTNIPANLSNVVAIVAGNTGNLAIKSDGTTWGSGTFTNIIGAYSNVVAGALVANGNYQGAVVTGDGSAYAWGYPSGTNITVVSNVTAVVGRSGFNQAGAVWALRRDGTLAGLGSQYLGQTNVYMNLSNVLAIAIGYTHHLAIVGDSFPKPIEPMLNAGFNNGQFAIAQPTSLGRSYWLEYKNSFTDDWQMFPPLPGNGSTQILADPNPPPAQRFYRVRVGQ